MAAKRWGDAGGVSLAVRGTMNALASAGLCLTAWVGQRFVRDPTKGLNRFKVG